MWQKQMDANVKNFEDLQCQSTGSINFSRTSVTNSASLEYKRTSFYYSLVSDHLVCCQDKKGMKETMTITVK
jgi:hypothetical protein